MAEERIELPQGTLDLLILKALALESMHGWAISERLQQISREALQVQIGQLQQQERESRVQLAAAQEGRVAEVRERSELARTIGELQAQIETEQQDVEFYRGVLAQPGQQATVIVGVQQFHIAPLPGSQNFALRFSLSRLQRPGEPISGALANSG